MRNEKWCVILNPKAGKRNLRKDWVKIYRVLKRAEVWFTVWTTEYAGHATEIVRNLVDKGCRNIIVVGGDGTLNEVVNGIYTSKIEDKNQVTLALIPYGTGNDWARYWGLLKHKKKNVETLYNRHRVKVDVGCLTYNTEGKEQKHYFLNGAGFGFDASVVQTTNSLKRIYGGHSWVYSLSVLLTIFKWKSVAMELTTDEIEIKKDIFTISVGNSCYSGGGLKQTPADPTDGVFHITAIEKPAFFKLFGGLGYLFRGELWKLPVATLIKTKVFNVKSQTNLMIETDGVMVEGEGPYKIEVIEDGLNMVV